MEYHKPVLSEEVITYLAPQPNKIYVDVTFGGGGHTRAILETEPACRVVAIDWDKHALEENGAALQEEFPGRIELVYGNFAQLTRLLQRINITRVDGILADFGTSQYQIAQEPGFSFTADTPLDMRMSPGHYRTTAADIVNRASAYELKKIFQRYGEERFSGRIAKAIVDQRKQKKFTTTKELADLIKRVVPDKKHKIHPATRVFQALRIVVNHELDNIYSLLYHAPQVLNEGGRLVCISFHSLEDRMVKQYLKDNKEIFNILTPRVVTPHEKEIKRNPSARSAKLRAAEKK